MSAREILKCEVLAIELRSALVTFRLAPENCCDMEGAIHLATMLLPEVELIATCEGSNLDTHYRKEKGKWVVSQVGTRSIASAIKITTDATSQLVALNLGMLRALRVMEESICDSIAVLTTPEPTS